MTALLLELNRGSDRTRPGTGNRTHHRGRHARPAALLFALAVHCTAVGHAAGQAGSESLADLVDGVQAANCPTPVDARSPVDVRLPDGPSEADDVEALRPIVESDAPAITPLVHGIRCDVEARRLVPGNEGALPVSDFEAWRIASEHAEAHYDDAIGFFDVDVAICAFYLRGRRFEQLALLSERVVADETTNDQEQLVLEWSRGTVAEQFLDEARDRYSRAEVIARDSGLEDGCGSLAARAQDAVMHALSGAPETESAEAQLITMPEGATAIGLTRALAPSADLALFSAPDLDAATVRFRNHARQTLVVTDDSHEDWIRVSLGVDAPSGTCFPDAEQGPGDVEVHAWIPRAMTHPVVSGPTESSSEAGTAWLSGGQLVRGEPGAYQVPIDGTVLSVPDVSVGHVFVAEPVAEAVPRATGYCYRTAEGALPIRDAEADDELVRGVVVARGGCVAWEVAQSPILEDAATIDPGNITWCDEASWPATYGDVMAIGSVSGSRGRVVALEAVTIPEGASLAWIDGQPAGVALRSFDVYATIGDDLRCFAIDHDRVVDPDAEATIEGSESAPRPLCIADEDAVRWAGP